MHPGKRALLITAFAILLAGCFSEPVKETLSIEFREAPAVTVVANTEIQDDAKEGSPLAARLARLRDELAAERDFWSNRFALISPASEDYTRLKVGGKISKVTRSATIDRNELARMLAGFAELSIVSSAGWDEIDVGVAKSDRATSAEKNLVSSKLDDWSGRYATHVAAITAMLRYFNEHPDRRRTIMARILAAGDLPEKYSADTLTDDDEKILKAVQESDSAVIDPLSEQHDTAYTFEEMTRRVYDPFPAEVTVTTPGKILECEGFLCKDARVARIPKLSLVGSIPKLERWAAPDPLMTLINDQDNSDLEAKLDAYLARPVSISAAVPSATDVRNAIDRILTPPTTYRLRWRVAPEAAN